MPLRLHEYSLPLRHPFTISRGSKREQRTLIVELAAEGLSGFGEAPEYPFYGATIPKIVEVIAKLRPLLESFLADRAADPARLWNEMAQAVGWSEDGIAGGAQATSFALCAVDQAAHDLWGKRLGEPVYKLWGLEVGVRPRSNYTIGIADIATMVAKLNEFPGWPLYKIKLGTPNDVEIIRALRRHTEALFRVDANCGWTPDETLRNADAFQTLGVEFIEQPLPRESWSEMRRLCELSSLPLIADESCQTEGDVLRCEGHFHGVNIKLVKCGGLTPARRMIARARSLGLRVMMGCMTESSVGISALAQLLPLLDYVDMDGAVLLARDPAEGVTVVRGECEYPSANGSGVRIHEPGSLVDLPETHL